MSRANWKRGGGRWAVLSLSALASLSWFTAAKAEETPAERGYRVLTTMAFFKTEFTPETFADLWTVWEEPSRSQAEQADPETRRKMTYSRYGLNVAPGRDDARPLQYAATTDGGWAVNCFSCHGGKVAGQTIPGAPNTHIALETMREDLGKWFAKHGGSGKLVDNGMPGVPLGGSNGTTNSVIFGVALALRRDFDMNYIPRASLPALPHHDHDAPPWWNTKRKKMMYIDGFAPKSHRGIMPFLMLPQTGPEQFKAFEDDFKDILAYIESVPVPKYPFSVDESLASAGKTAFTRVCAECHGTYGPDGAYPERNVPLDVVGTDPVRWKALSPLSRRGHQISWFGEYGKHKVIANPKGYTAPPLDGIWASAPYLHNGSVPTLWALFHADRRPTVWIRSEDGYDQQRVGLEVTELADVPSESSTPAEKRRYFDTRLVGKSASGHEFPEQLSEEEKIAVIEYLKTL